MYKTEAFWKTSLSYYQYRSTEYTNTTHVHESKEILFIGNILYLTIVCEVPNFIFVHSPSFIKSRLKCALARHRFIWAFQGISSRNIWWNLFFLIWFNIIGVKLSTRNWNASFLTSILLFLPREKETLKLHKLLDI